MQGSGGFGLLLLLLLVPVPPPLKLSVSLPLLSRWPPHQVPSAAAYSSLLQQQSIQLDLDARRKAIWEAATAAAAEVRGAWGAALPHPVQLLPCHAPPNHNESLTPQPAVCVSNNTGRRRHPRHRLW